MSDELQKMAAAQQAGLNQLGGLGGGLGAGPALGGLAQTAPEPPRLERLVSTLQDVNMHQQTVAESLAELAGYLAGAEGEALLKRLEEHRGQPVESSGMAGNIGNAIDLADAARAQSSLHQELIGMIRRLI